MRTVFSVAVITVMLHALPSSGTAQVRLGVGGGPVTPVGSLADVTNAGFHGGVVLELGVPLLPVSLRGDLMLQRLPGTGDVPNLNEVYATANARFGVLPIPLVSAYFTGGVGMYSSSWDADPAATTSRTTDVGVNVGIGGSANLIVVRPFIEARLHRVFGDNARSFVPVTVGVYF